ncbi:FeoA family protein [Candidatus Marinimicrobia bacterium]|nr:FeoA family protein [Candidatus Neomarinimicrobiota bacterium]
MTLIDLDPSQVGIIENLNGDSKFKTRLMEMGFSIGIKVRLINKMPFSGPITIRIRNGMLSLRKIDASKIKIKLDG